MIRRRWGRLVSPDARDRRYLVRHILPPRPSRRRWRYWQDSGWWGDQGSTPQCVAYAWLHWLADSSVRQPGPQPELVPRALYDLAQAVDEWPGTGYDGTSVRAGAKVLSDRRYIAGYYWATRLEEVVETLLELGPVVVGTNWYDGMMEPGTGGLVALTGPIVGGHAWCLNGVSKETERFRLKNSWGREWGVNGRGWISWTDFGRLLREDGEVCLAQEAIPTEA